MINKITLLIASRAYLQHMAFSHFAYNMMKMPAPWGVLMVKDDVGMQSCVFKISTSP